MRTLATELTTALESGSYTPYFRVHLIDTDGTSIIDSFEPSSFEIKDLECKVTFHTEQYVEDFAFFHIERGVIIASTPYTLSTSNWYPRRSTWINQIQQAEGKIFPQKAYSAPGDDTYENIITDICATYNKTATFLKPSAAWLDYQFLPTGKTLNLWDVNRFFTMLRQKYLIFATDNGNEEILFFHAYDRMTDPTQYTVLTPKLNIEIFQTQRRRYLSRDEASSTHYTGDPEDPIHNLGFLHSTADHPSYFFSFASQSSPARLAPHLKYQTSDSIILQQLEEPNNLQSGIVQLQVTEVFDNTYPKWAHILNQLQVFSTTEGGAMPSTLEASAPYTPLNTSTFDNNLDDTVNNLQALAEAVDELNLGSTTEEIQDIVGAMFSGNTETGITVTYDDTDGTIDLVVTGGSSDVPAALKIILNRSFH